MRTQELLDHYFFFRSQELSNPIIISFSGLKNWKEETPIVHIAPDIMEEYLDDCLEGEELATADKFKITFKYHFLGPPRMKTEGNEPLLKDQGGGTEVRKELPETEPLW